MEPLAGRTIPIIADRAVDKDTGTGCLKVTPAHSAIDFKIAEHKLPVVNVIDAEARMTDKAPEKYRGMKVEECREAVLVDLKELGLLEKVEDITHEVIVCERCRHDVEQIISKQWFVNVEPLAKKAIEALKEGKTVVYPANQGRVLKQWFEHIEPWCISRQLWWGHRIPVWYCGSKELLTGCSIIRQNERRLSERNRKNAMVRYGNSRSHAPRKCPKCGGVHIESETDFLTHGFVYNGHTGHLGGPGTEDYKKYYPTDVMETMRDILFFWVARMMMMCIYRTGTTPFHTVYLHGMILAEDGTKMSKSRGNGVWPDEVFGMYGADAVRLW